MDLIEWFRKTYIFTMNPAKKSFFYEDSNQVGMSAVICDVASGDHKNAKKWPAVSDWPERERSYLAVRVP